MELTIDDLTMAYSYASDKQITAELIAGDILPSSGFTSSYDAGNRLTTWQTPLASASTQQQAWNYDNAGNWNSTTINGTTENRTHNAADQLNTIAGNAATNDLKGNLTAYEINGKDYEVEYDLDNRIIKVDVDNSDVEYRYDAFGRRIIRQEGSTKSALIWWGNSENAEHKHQAGQTVIQNDIMAHPSRLNSVIARAKDGSKFKLEWYHKNYLDHVYAVSDDSGDILEHYRYTAFGEVTIYNENGQVQNTTQIDNHILWNTRRRDEVTGYYMYKFRHYSAELGRWPSRDPIEEGFWVKNPNFKTDINLYTFVLNSPFNYSDYQGLVGFTLYPGRSNCTGYAMTGGNPSVDLGINDLIDPNNSLIDSLQKRYLWKCKKKYITDVNKCKCKCSQHKMVLVALNRNPNNKGKDPYSDKTFVWKGFKTDLHAILSLGGCNNNYTHKPGSSIIGRGHPIQPVTPKWKKNYYMDGRLKMLCCCRDKKHGYKPTGGRE